MTPEHHVFTDVLEELGFSRDHETFSDMIFRRDFGFRGDHPYTRPQDERKLSTIEVHVGRESGRVRIRWSTEFEKCQIQWVDSRGVLTPDDNPAVVLAVLAVSRDPTNRAHDARIAPGVLGRRAFPCCAAHREKLHELIDRQLNRRGDRHLLEWTEEPLPAQFDSGFGFPDQWPYIMERLKELISLAEVRASYDS